MSRTEEIVHRTERELSGVRGWLAGLAVLRRGLRAGDVRAAAARLRRAADVLEELL